MGASTIKQIFDAGNSHLSNSRDYLSLAQDPRYRDFLQSNNNWFANMTEGLVARPSLLHSPSDNVYYQSLRGHRSTQDVEGLVRDQRFQRLVNTAAQQRQQELANLHALYFAREQPPSHQASVNTSPAIVVQNPPSAPSELPRFGPGRNLGNQSLDDLIKRGGVLRPNDWGQPVRDYQEFLAQQGLYRGEINGEYSRETQLASKKFQEQHPGCGAADLIVGRNTHREIANVRRLAQALERGQSEPSSRGSDDVTAAITDTLQPPRVPTNRPRTRTPSQSPS